MREEKQRDFIRLNFRNNTLEYKPAVLYLRFIIFQSGVELPFWVQAGFSHATAEKLRWIASFFTLPETPEPKVILLEGETPIAHFEMKADMFPVESFAKNFKLDRILDKGLETMNLDVEFSLPFTPLRSAGFFHWTKQDACMLSFNKVNPGTGEILESDIAVLEAKIIAPDNIMIN